MSDKIQHIDVDSEEWEHTPKALRDHVRRLQEALTSVSGERDQFRTQLTERSLGDVLKAQGFKNPKRVQRDLVSDGIDPLDEAAVESWLKDNADDYAKGEPAPPADADEQRQPTQADIDRLNLGSDYAQPTELGKGAEVFAEITPEMTGAQVEALFRQRGL